MPYDSSVKQEEEELGSFQLDFCTFSYCTSQFCHSLEIEYRGQKNDNDLIDKKEDICSTSLTKPTWTIATLKLLRAIKYCVISKTDVALLL